MAKRAKKTEPAEAQGGDEKGVQAQDLEPLVEKVLAQAVELWRDWPLLAA